MKRSAGASRTRRMLLVALSILVTIHRLPAPIVEPEEKATPTPEALVRPTPKPSVKPTPERSVKPAPEPPVKPTLESPVKPTPKEKTERKVKNTSSGGRERQKAASPTPIPLSTPVQSIFAGTWRGEINLFPASFTQGIGRLSGNFKIILVVNAGGTEVTESSRLGTSSEQVVQNNNTIRWQSGILKEMPLTLVPNPDGKTALVKCKSSFYGDPSAVFRRTAP